MPYLISNYSINGLSLFLLLSGIAGLMVALFLYRFRGAPGVVFLALLQTSIAIWTICYFFEYSATTANLKLRWSQLSYLGITFIPVWFYLFSINFKSREHKVSVRIKLPLISVALMFIVLVFTNDWHQLHWKSMTINEQHNTSIYQYGPAFWLLYVFIYGFITLGLVNMFHFIRRYSKQINESIWLLVVACLIPILGNLIYVFKLNPIPGFDWTPLFFSTTGAILIYVNIRFGSVDLIPFARTKLIDAMSDGFLLCDRNNRVADINTSMLQLVGRSRKELLGQQLIDLFPQQIELISRLRPDADAVSASFYVPGKTDKCFYSFRSTALFDRNQMLCGQLIIARDITTIKRHEETIMASNAKLLRENQEKEMLIEDLDSFAHTVAHDLKNTIGSIVGLSEMIGAEIEENELTAASQYAGLINNSARKTLYIMDELLTLATVRQQDITKERVDMNLIVDEAKTRLNDLIAGSQASILVDRQLPDIPGISAWLEEVWVNFISNAIKYGGKPPVIRLGAEQLYAEGKIKYWIKDNGSGLSADDQHKLFTKYTRLDANHAVGTGLGLSIVKRIIEKLGGETGVISNAIPGEGCLFYFILPTD
ncbi:histidine kinase N-terminal 7TM domain-containing protein [Mangrovibacterium marinum]|uniref:histidine kinase n=1 Tax=Mangrovibacterium marinum TaxID=1639118 RepID=A0A2T5C0A7_9BACT|nr:histidine kinase N-terminal 7TM domain-containing protein [Mangrovibacterium marinum]PTN07937.1 PAS/PAC sensor signal transduction histidine kinase [Mangrovibacterium marinum]